MSSTPIITQNKNAVNFRYGQDFTFENQRFAWRRQGYGNKLVVGVVDAAIKGFNIIDKETKEPIKNNLQAQEVIETMWLDIKKTMYYDRAYGKSLGMFWLIDGQELPIWRAYDIRNYYASYDEFAIPTKYQVNNIVGGMEAKFKTVEVIDEMLETTFEIITREAMTKGDGLSVLEPVWDTLYALNTLDENATYYAIRYGPGIRYLKIPESKLKDVEYMAKINAMLFGALGVNGLFSLPYATLGGNKTEEVSIHSDSAVQINFPAIRDLLLGTLSAQTGIPREVLLGSQTGLRSSEKNEDAYFDVLQSIQDDYRRFLKWIVNTLNDMFGWYPDTVMIDIDYFNRESMNEEEKAQLLGDKIKIASNAGFNVPKVWLAEQLGIPLEEKETPPQLIPSSNKEDDDGKKTDDEPEEEPDETEEIDEDDDDSEDE